MDYLLTEEVRSLKISQIRTFLLTQSKRTCPHLTTIIHYLRSFNSYALDRQMILLIDKEYWKINPNQAHAHPDNTFLSVYLFSGSVIVLPSLPDGMCLRMPAISGHSTIGMGGTLTKNNVGQINRSYQPQGTLAIILLFYVFCCTEV